MSSQKPILTLSRGLSDANKQYVLVALHGEMDKIGLNLVKDELEKLVSDFPCRYLVFDFTDLDYIISESIGFLMSLHAHLAKDQKTLVIIAAKSHVKDVLDAIGIMSVFPYYNSLNDFKDKIA